jgi:hypothetical protein
MDPWLGNVIARIWPVAAVSTSEPAGANAVVPVGR